MNESLINPFNISHPTVVQTSLFASALFARFDPSGRYIGVGTFSGAAGIWDLETRSRVRVLEGHVKAVTSLDWSANSRWVLTSSKDWNAIVWDLGSRCEPIQRHATIRCDAPVVSASFHPRNSNVILVLMGTGESFVADLRNDQPTRIELIEIAEADSTRSAMTVARFDPSGKYIYVGTSSGSLLVFNTRTKSMIARHRIPGAGTLKGLDFVKSGRRFVTNSSDRTIRQFTSPTYSNSNGSSENTFIDDELEPTHRFNDPINRTAWYAMSYSPDGEWLAGGAADPATHKIYIWDLSNDGQFSSTLDGGREPLVHLHWHPKKSSLASTTNHGNVLVWHYPNPERWGAFAGGFEEVDENIDYQEREDEFDIEDEEEIRKRRMKGEEEDVNVDGLGEETNGASEGMDIEDEDVIWADQDKPDTGEFKMKIVIQEDSEM